VSAAAPGSGGRRRLLAAAAVAAVGVGLAVAAGGLLRRGEWAVVSRGDLVLSVPVAGTLRAVDSAKLGPPQLANYWSFKISFLAPEGTEVKAGQAVLGFDASELQRELEKISAEADQARQDARKRRAEVAVAAEDARLKLAEAEAALRRAELKLAVPPELEPGSVLKTTELDREQAQREVAYLTARTLSERRGAEAEIAKLQEIEHRAAARVVEIRDAIARLTVRAPRAGTVSYVSNRRDEKKKVGDTAWRRDVVLEIPDLSRMMAVGQVDEADSGRLALGQRVTLRMDAHPDLELGGSIVGIGQTVERRSQASPEKVVTVEIGLDATDRMRMRPGMRVAGRVEVRRIAAAVLVPADVVTATPEGPTALRRTPFGVRETKLRLGEGNGEMFEVLGGLVPGDAVRRRNAGATGVVR
jgi:HlyD family secretion protein